MITSGLSLLVDGTELVKERFSMRPVRYNLSLSGNNSENFLSNGLKPFKIYELVKELKSQKP
jgi:hypothetical protein